MNLLDLKNEIRKYQYFEDDRVIDVTCASIIACRLKLGDPIWMVVIGASSGGKSQILRPLSLTDTKFMHRIDDLTENTFLSGMKVGKGQPEPSLLYRIGPKGMIVMSDLTVLFSKNKEARGTILSQFRMLYDGELTKFSGASGEPLHWKGYLGVLAGSTPSIYGHFEEVADMGERFIYWRLKDYDPEKATRLAMGRTMYGSKLDDLLSDQYGEYIKGVVNEWKDKDFSKIVLPKEVQERILRISLLAERVRTTVQMDFHKKDITRIPVCAMPMRTSLQLTALAKGLYVMRNGKMTETDMGIIDWCGYSLANEEKRGILKILCKSEYGRGVSSQRVADMLGLSTAATSNILHNLSAVGVLQRDGGSDGLLWKIKSQADWELVRQIEEVRTSEDYEERQLSIEEAGELEKVHDHALNAFGVPPDRDD